MRLFRCSNKKNSKISILFQPPLKSYDSFNFMNFWCFSTLKTRFTNFSTRKWQKIQSVITRKVFLNIGTYLNFNANKKGRFSEKVNPFLGTFKHLRIIIGSKNFICVWERLMIYNMLQNVKHWIVIKLRSFGPYNRKQCY